MSVWSSAYPSWSAQPILTIESYDHHSPGHRPRLRLSIWFWVTGNSSCSGDTIPCVQSLWPPSTGSCPRSRNFPATPGATRGLETGHTLLRVLLGSCAQAYCRILRLTIFGVLLGLSGSKTTTIGVFRVIDFEKPQNLGFQNPHPIVGLSKNLGWS